MKFICFLFFCVFFASVGGQNTYSVTGVIRDLEKQPLEGISVRLLSVKDSLFLSGTVSDEKGRFLVHTSRSECLLEITCVGYLPKREIIRFVKKQKSVDLGEISLCEDTTMLKEVTVTGHVPAISMRGDTLEYNADSYAVSEYASVRDLLRALPNVKVTDDGKITVQGEEIKKIVVDGKELFSGDPDLASKTLPSRMVEKVQVLKRGSEADRLSGFESGEKESVINLTVKEKMKVSVMSNLAGGWGHDLKKGRERHDINGYVNLMDNQDFYSVSFGDQNTGGTYGGGDVSQKNVALDVNKTFSERFTLNGGVSYDLTNSASERTTHRTTFLPANEPLYENTSSLISSESKKMGAFVRADWKPDKQNTLILVGGLNIGRDRSFRSDRFESLNAARDTLYNGRAGNHDKTKNSNWSLSADYAYRFRKEGRVLSTSLSTAFQNMESGGQYDWLRRLYSDAVYMRDSLMNQHTETDNPNRVLQFLLSYVEPILKKSFLQVMYSLNTMDNENIRSTYGSVERYAYSGDSLVLLPLLSNGTLQNSMTHRFTLNFKSVREKYDYTVGVNLDLNHSDNKNYQPSSAMEQMYPVSSYENRLPNVRGDSLLSEVRQDYLNFSPVANFVYRFNKNTNLRVDYHGYMRSPSTQQLRDFTDVTNPMNSIKGNPDLKPQFQNMLFMNVSGSDPVKQTFYFISLQGQYVANEIKSTTVLSPETGNRMTTYQNVNGNWSSDFRASFGIPLGEKKQFSVGNMLSLSYSRMKSFVNNGLSVMTLFGVEESPRISYNSKKVRMSLEGMFRYSDARNSTIQNTRIRTYDWGTNAAVFWNLPLEFTIESRLCWTKKTGYGEQADYSETLWDASLNKRFSLKKYGTLSLRLSADDILQSRKSFSRYIGDSSIEDVTTSITGSYFMCSLIYNFSVFPNQ